MDIPERKKLIKNIKRRYSSFIKNTPDIDGYTEEKEQLIADLMYDFSKYSISTYFPEFQNDFNGNHDFYIGRYLLAFENYYIKNSLLSKSPEHFFQDDFFRLWKSFKKELTNLTPVVAKEIGPQTHSLYKYVTETQKKYSALDNPPKKSTRFWKYYVCRKQKESNSKSVPAFACHSFLRKEELPFYLILYAIYYYADYDYEHEAFSDFGMQFRQFQKFGEINKILLWCVSCYCEWFNYCIENPKCNKNIKITDHVPGIPLFLEHFGFFWHKGLQENKNQLLYFFDTLSCDPLSDITFLNIPYIDYFLMTHRINTQPLLTNKEVLNKERKRQKERKISDNSSYIDRLLENYFLLENNALSKYFLVPINSPKKEHTYDILDVALRKFISSLFLAFISVENDILTYINTHLYFCKLIHILSTVYFEDELSREEAENIYDELWNYILGYISTYTMLKTEDIYTVISMPYYNELLNHTSLQEDELNNYICMHYLSAFSLDDTTS